MNRILTADVILTLTAEQAIVLRGALALASISTRDQTLASEFDDLALVVISQARKQGVDA